MSRRPELAENPTFRSFLAATIDFLSSELGSVGLVAFRVGVALSAASVEGKRVKDYIGGAAIVLKC